MATRRDPGREPRRPFILGKRTRHDGLSRRQLAKLGDSGPPLAPPINTVAPSITTDGTPTTGETVTCSTGTWSPTGSYTYQWKRNGVAIGGATANARTLVQADEGTSLTCTVTATNADGSASATSAAISPQAAAAGATNVRVFDGSSAVIRASVGGLGAVPNGAYSMVALVKPNGLTAGTFIGLCVANANMLASLSNSSGNLVEYTDDEDSRAAALVSDAEWQLVAVTKAAGASAPRFHRKKLGAGAWTHAARDGGSATIPDKATAVTRVHFGAGVSFGNPALFKACKIAAAAVYGTALSDSALEAIETAATTAALLAAGSGALAAWQFNQAAITDAVNDLVGSANQNAIVGTTVDTGDAPTGWVFS
jgi:hypothetical protein